MWAHTSWLWILTEQILLDVHTLKNRVVGSYVSLLSCCVDHILNSYFFVISSSAGLLEDTSDQKCPFLGGGKRKGKYFIHYGLGPGRLLCSDLSNAFFFLRTKYLVLAFAFYSLSSLVLYQIWKTWNFLKWITQQKVSSTLAVRGLLGCEANFLAAE